MASPILTLMDDRLVLDIDLSGLAAGACVISTPVDNTALKRTAAKLLQSIKTGAVAPAAMTSYLVYLVPYDGTHWLNGWNGVKGSFTPDANTPQLGAITVPTATANLVVWGSFDTAPLGPLGRKWAVAIKNDTAQAGATDAAEGATPEGVFTKGYQTYSAEV